MDEEMSGVMQQEEAAPATDLDNINPDAGYDVEQEQPQQETEPQEQPKEQPPEQQEEPQEQIPNRVWAAARKRAEQEAQTRIDREFARRCAGAKNPRTGQPITNAREYWEAIDAQNEMRREAALRQATKNADAQQLSAIRDIIQNDPEKVRMRAELDELKRAETVNAAVAQLDADLREVGKLDPAIKTQADLEKLPEYNDILALVQAGYTLPNAYKVVRYDSAVQASEKSGRQAAINAARGKNHLAAHGGNATPGKSKSIPADRVSWYKDMFPDKSMDELTKLYNMTL